MGVYDLDYYQQDDKALGAFGCLCIVLPLVLLAALAINGMQIYNLKRDVRRIRHEIQIIKMETQYKTQFQLPPMSGDKTVPTQVADMQ